MHIAIASDHAGLDLRRTIKNHLEQAGKTVLDLGPDSTDSVDYPDFAEKVTRAVLSGETNLGILICGSGVGMSMSANKVPGIRAALCFNAYMGKMCRAHNNANVLCLGERVVGAGVALEVVDAFVMTPFDGGRHGARLEKMAALATANQA